MKVAVVGFGMMGRQIAQLFIQHGNDVNVTDPYPAALKAGLEEIENGPYGLNALVSKGKISEAKKTEVLSKLHTAQTIEEATKGTDLVIEAAIEDLALKQTIFHQLDKTTNQNTILASNTSTISIARISQQATNKSRILGIHFFNPAQVTRLVEIIQSDQTSIDNVNRALQIAREVGKTPIISKDEPGFIANRLGLTLYMEASRMLEDGVADVNAIDTALKLGFGHAMGPFETADLVGLDTRLRNLESLYTSTQDARWLPPKILREMVNQGYIGKAGKGKQSKGGYYDHPDLIEPAQNSNV